MFKSFVRFCLPCLLLRVACTSSSSPLSHSTINWRGFIQEEEQTLPWQLRLILQFPFFHKHSGDSEVPNDEVKVSSSSLLPLSNGIIRKFGDILIAQKSRVAVVLKVITILSLSSVIATKLRHWFGSLRNAISVDETDNQYSLLGASLDDIGTNAIGLDFLDRTTVKKYGYNSLLSQLDRALARPRFSDSLLEYIGSIDLETQFMSHGIEMLFYHRLHASNLDITKEGKNKSSGYTGDLVTVVNVSLTDVSMEEAQLVRLLQRGVLVLQVAIL